MPRILPACDIDYQNPAIERISIIPIFRSGETLVYGLVANRKGIITSIGGHVEPDKDLNALEALQREVSEEVGDYLSIDWNLLGNWHAIEEGSSYTLIIPLSALPEKPLPFTEEVTSFLWLTERQIDIIIGRTAKSKTFRLGKFFENIYPLVQAASSESELDEQCTVAKPFRPKAARKRNFFDILDNDPHFFHDRVLAIYDTTRKHFLFADSYGEIYRVADTRETRRRLSQFEKSYRRVSIFFTLQEEWNHFPKNAIRPLLLENFHGKHSHVFVEEELAKYHTLGLRDPEQKLLAMIQLERNVWDNVAKIISKEDEKRVILMFTLSYVILYRAEGFEYSDEELVELIKDRLPQNLERFRDMVSTSFETLHRNGLIA